MKIELILDDEYEFYANRYDVVPSPYDLGISYCIDEDYTLEKFLANSNGVLNCVETGLESTSIKYYSDEQLKTLELLKENPELGLNSIEYIRLAFSNIDYLEYIKNTPCLQDKKIVLTEFLEIKSIDRAMEYMNKYAEYKDNIYIDFSNNYGYTKLEDAYKAIYTIKKQADDIIQLGLSPLETIMYTYDKVRERVYNAEDINEDKELSRDLTSVLTGDKIVCTGYAELFSAILDYLGFDNKTYSMQLKKFDEGHTRNIVYLKDEKYKIDGLYFFDCTFDSQQKDNENNYLGVYKFFAKTKKQIDDLDKGRFIEDDYFYLNPDMKEELQEIIDNQDYDLIEKNNIASAINHTASLVLNKRIIDRINLIESFPERYGKFDHEQFLADVALISDKIDRPISAEVFIKALNEVRKLEFYQEPAKYPYSLENMAEAFYRSKWKFDNEYLTKEEQLLFYIFGKENREEEDPAKDFAMFTTKHEMITKDIAQIHLTKALETYSKSRKL